jgi:hypothetical protein
MSHGTVDKQQLGRLLTDEEKTYVRTTAAKSTHAEMKEYIDGLPLSEDDKLMLMRLAEMAALMKVAGKLRIERGGIRRRCPLPFA